MSDTTVTVSMTSFATFCAADPTGQLAKVREIRRQYEQDYRLAVDFWSRFRNGLESVHRKGGTRDDLAKALSTAHESRRGPYSSALDGYRRFWGKKNIELMAALAPALWAHDRLQVRVNPEFLLRINGKPTIMKLHLKERLPLNQRLANPLLYLLESNFGSGDTAIAILDVHRGKIWTSSKRRASMEHVLHMQAAAFLVGWDSCGPTAGAA